MKVSFYSLFFLLLLPALSAKTIPLDFRVTDFFSDNITLDSISNSYMDVVSVELSEVENSASLNFDLLFVKEIGSVITVVDKLIALGEKIWKIVEAGEPVYQKEFQTIHVLPHIEGEHIPFYEMENWAIPKSKSYKLVYKNGLGFEVVTFHFAVMFQYGGQYDGKGRYITGLNIIPKTIDVSWGFEFNSKSSMLSIANMGSKDFPIASTVINVEFIAKSAIKVIDSSMTFHIDGNGNLLLLN